MTTDITLSFSVAMDTALLCLERAAGCNHLGTNHRPLNTTRSSVTGLKEFLRSAAVVSKTIWANA